LERTLHLDWLHGHHAVPLSPLPGSLLLLFMIALRTKVSMFEPVIIQKALVLDHSFVSAHNAKCVTSDALFPLRLHFRKETALKVSGTYFPTFVEEGQ
jgi:hypothetical protein